MKPVVVLLVPESTLRLMFREADLARLRDEAQVVGPVDPLTPQQIVRALRGASVAITGWGTPPMTPDIWAQADSLKLVAHSAGTVKYLIDESFFRLGKRITTAASGNAVAVAQFTVAMIASMLKQVPWISTAYAAGDTAEMNRRKAVVKELQDLPIGILGASRVGREVIRLLQSYPRLQIKVYDPYLTPAAAAAMGVGVELVDLNTACRCPVVSVHAPNTPETHHMLNSRTLSLLPDHAVLVNTARGALVDEAALVAELRRRPLYVQLDVTDPEPPALDSPLRSQKNVILTPHIAGAMNQACRDMGQIAIEQALRFLRDQPLEHEVTAAMFATQA